MCSGRVDPQFVLDAFAKGADGVLIGGCHPGDCHYDEGNYKTLRRFQHAAAHACATWASKTSACAWSGSPPPRARRSRRVINDMVEKVQRARAARTCPQQFAGLGHAKWNVAARSRRAGACAGAAQPKPEVAHA